MSMKVAIKLANDCNILLKSGYRIRYKLNNLTGCRSYSTERNVLRSSYPDMILPDIPLHQYVWKNLHKWPNHIAIECGVSGKKFSYNQLYKKCKNFCSSLKKLGIKRGDSIGIFLTNTPDFPIAYLGALEAGLIPTSINPNYTKHEVLYQLRHCNTEWIICHPTNINLLLEIESEIKKKINIISTHNIDNSTPKIQSGVILLEDMVNDDIDESDTTNNDLNLDETALIAYSSGTTGLPKGTCLTHFSISSNLAQMTVPDVDKFFSTTNDHQDVVPAILPFFHSYGFVFVLLQSLTKGAKIITLPNFDPKLYLKIIENNSNLLLITVPPILFFLGNSELVKQKHFNNMRELLTAAAPICSDDIIKIKNKMNNPSLFSQGYGMTEASPTLTYYMPQGTDKDDMTTIGKLLPNTWGKVISIETGEALPPNASGELCFKGPQLMKCYLNNDQATSETIDSDGWLHTGDLGYYNEDGLFYITDRIKELIKVKGLQVAPAELEGVLRKYPGVLDAGVVGAPNKFAGQTPVAFLQTVPGSNITENEIKAYISSQFSNHKHLSSVKFLPAIPKTASGKILRRHLAKLV